MSPSPPSWFLMQHAHHTGTLSKSIIVKYTTEQTKENLYRDAQKPTMIVITQIQHKKFNAGSIQTPERNLPPMPAAWTLPLFFRTCVYTPYLFDHQIPTGGWAASLEHHTQEPICYNVRLVRRTRIKIQKHTSTSPFAKVSRAGSSAKNPLLSLPLLERLRNACASS